MNDVRNCVLVMGDSHTQVFKSGKFPFNFPNYRWDVLTVVGATISGIDNPNSKTNAMQLFFERLEKRDFSKVILQLGEVDIGFVMWFKSQRDGIPVEEYFYLTLIKYQSFINDIKRYCDDILVVSVPLPTIRDGETLGEVANQRSSVKASQRERTDFTLLFNRKLRDFCLTQNIEFLDLDSLSLNEDGLVSDTLRNKNKTDHHYCKFAYASMLVDGLKKIFSSRW